MMVVANVGLDSEKKLKKKEKKKKMENQKKLSRRLPVPFGGALGAKYISHFKGPRFRSWFGALVVLQSSRKTSHFKAPRALSCERRSQAQLRKMSKGPYRVQHHTHLPRLGNTIHSELQPPFTLPLTATLWVKHQSCTCILA